MNEAARTGSTASMHATRLSARKTAIASAGPSGVLERLKRPVASATAITTAKTASAGAGSTFTTANSRKPSATAAS